MNIQDLIIEVINRLKEIELNKRDFESSEEYIELMIAKEKCEKTIGYVARIEGLQIIKKQKQLLREIFKKKQ